MIYNENTTDHNYHLSVSSKNGKTGIPTSTTSSESCWTGCGQFDNCYGKFGPLALHWKKVTAGERGMSLDEFCEAIEALPEGQRWRHNQAGDLPGKDGEIDIFALRKLIRANRGRNGFTYTHKPMDSMANQITVLEANDNGFTVNLSADNPAMADELADLGIGPVVTVVPSWQKENSRTPAGRLIVVCPADHVTGEDRGINCGTCKLCAWRDRSTIIGFPAHGTKKKAIDKTFVQLEALTQK